mmetsp:Transcript_18831/g.40436  ORF Transcript_18831/g.40436 Transcript_18831/m.40436 type:complete len:208 (-) Transcript_18831:681-1304(-)
MPAALLLQDSRQHGTRQVAAQDVAAIKQQLCQRAWQGVEQTGRFNVFLRHKRDVAPRAFTLADEGVVEGLGLAIWQRWNSHFRSPSARSVAPRLTCQDDSAVPVFPVPEASPWNELLPTQQPRICGDVGRVAGCASGLPSCSQTEGQVKVLLCKGRMNRTPQSHASFFVIPEAFRERPIGCIELCSGPSVLFARGELSPDRRMGIAN